MVFCGGFRTPDVVQGGTEGNPILNSAGRQHARALYLTTGIRFATFMNPVPFMYSWYNLDRNPFPDHPREESRTRKTCLGLDSDLHTGLT